MCLQRNFFRRQNSVTKVVESLYDSKEMSYGLIIELTDNVWGDVGSVLGSGRSPGEGNGNPLQYSCLENSMDRGAGWATVHGVAERWTGLSS